MKLSLFISNTRSSFMNSSEMFCSTFSEKSNLETKRFVKEWMCEVLLSAVNSTGFRKIYARKNYRSSWLEDFWKKELLWKIFKNCPQFYQKESSPEMLSFDLTKFFRAAYSESTHEQLLLTAEKNKPKCKHWEPLK